MGKFRQLLSVGRLIVVFGFLVTILLPLQSNIATADEIGLLAQGAERQSSGAKMKEQPLRKGKGETPADTTKKAEVQKCIRGQGCLMQEASGVEPSVEQTTCTAGIVCSSEGSPCNRTFTLFCQTHDLGGGTCTCQCLPPI